MLLSLTPLIATEYEGYTATLKGAVSWQSSSFS